MLKKFLYLSVALLVGLLLAGLFISPEFNVEQSVVIQARPVDIHPYVDDLKQWPKWTPWQAIEPDIKIRYGNVTRGIGASQSWQGKGGSGHLNITASAPDNGIAYDIYFDKEEIPSIGAIEYQLLDNNMTRVTWRMHGEIEFPLLGGYIALITTMITADMFNKGLLRLKAVVERNTKPSGGTAMVLQRSVPLSARIACRPGNNRSC